MQSTWKLLVACSMLAALLVVAGCKGGSDAGTEAKPPSGDGDAATTPPGADKPAPSAAPPPATATPARVPPRVVIETSLGNITVELDHEKAPATVDNFLGYVESRFYDGTIFHQVHPGAVILGGGFTQDMQEKPAGPRISNEADNGLKNVRGTIAMARQYDVINSATCQFFINVKDNPNYDHKPGAQETLSPEDYGYCVFGRVTEGLEVVDRIANVEVRDLGDFERTPVEPVVIKSIRTVP